MPSVPRTVKFVIVFYCTLFAWWVSITWRGLIDTTENYIFGLVMALLPAIAGLGGIFLAKQWGLWGSYLGKGITFQSLGLLAWSIGTMVFAYYNLVLMVEVPYPSWADAAYVLTSPFWILGMYNLSKVTGAQFSLRQKSGKLLFVLLPLVTLTIATVVVVKYGLGGELNLVGETLAESFLNYFYPIDSIIALTLAVMVYGLSYRFLGGVYKVSIYLILAGFTVRYFSDLAFSVTTAQESFFVGSWVDMLGVTYLAILGIGLNMLTPRSAGSASSGK